MTDKQLSDRRLDEAIDRAVRDMMHVEPRSDLRARVLAELSGPARNVLWPRLAFAALALVLAVGALMTLRQTSSEDTRAPQIATSAPATPPATPAEGALRPVSPTVDTKPPVPRPGTAARVPRSPESSTATASGVQPPQDRLIQAASIDTVDDAATEAAGPVDAFHQAVQPTGVANLKPISQSEIVIRPITVERIEITPLSSRR